jgi:hypothetical protein
MVTRYHLSKTFLGNEIILKPQVPSSAWVISEGDIPRVCFSTNVFYCVRSICGGPKLKVNNLTEFKDRTIEEQEVSWDDFINEITDYSSYVFSNPSIYITEDKTYIPPSHGDFRSNRECWSLKETNVKFIGFLCLKNLINRKLLITNDNNTLQPDIFIQSFHKRIFKPHSMKLNWS